MFKKVLSILLASVLMLSTISFTVFAEDTDIIEVGAGKTCTTWSAAVAAAADNNSDKAITYHIYGKVEVDKTGWVSPRGTSGATTINFVGMTDDAELCIPTATSTVIATDNFTDMVAINYTDLILSRTAGAWVGDLGNANNYFVCWMRGADNAVVNYTDCTFPNGSCNNQYGKTVYNNCDFRNETEYCLWMYGGFGNATVEVNGGTMIGKKGAKTHAEITTSPVVAEIEGVTFDIESKPAIVVSALGSVELNDVDATACEYGILENGSTQGTAAVTIDGETPEYVATYTDKYNVTVYVTNMEYAEVGVTEAVANGKTSEIAAPAAQIGAVPYASLEAAIADAKENDTIKIFAGTYDGFNVPTELNNVTFVGETDADGNNLVTIKTLEEGIESHNGGIFVQPETSTFKNLNFTAGTVNGARSGWMSASIGNTNGDTGMRSNLTNLTIENCNFTGSGKQYAVWTNQGNITVKNSTITNYSTGIDNYAIAADQKVIIENTDIIEVYNAFHTGEAKAGAQINVIGGSINSDVINFGGAVAVTVNNAEISNADVTAYAESTITITNSTLTDTSYALADGATGTITLADNTESNVTIALDAKVGDVYYKTLQEAINAAESGETVEVLNDITFTEPWNQIWNKENLTINGNNHTLTFTQPNYSNGNGDAIIYGATNLTVNDLVIKFAENDTTSAGFYTNSGAFTNVDFYNGMFAIANTGAVAITDCTFNNQAWIAIYSNDGGNTTGTTITGCDFTDTRAYIARSNEVISGNEIICDEKEEIALAMTVAPSATSTVTNNTFNEGTQLELYNSESTITNNKILGTIYSAGDLSSTTVTDNKLSDAAEEVLNNSGLDVESVDPSFEVDGEKFFTLTDAIAVAEQGSVITLYADTDITAEDYSAIVLKELTLTLGDYTLTSETELADTSFITVPSGYKVKKTSTDGVYVYSIAKKTSSKKPSGNSGSYYPSYDYESDKYVPETEDKKDLSDFPFTDVASDFWGYDGIAYCWQNDIMNGMTGTTFEPETSLSRAMLVTMLYRLAGSPEVETTENEWYSAARAWAMNNTISDGTNMNDEITREQLATMLCRYAAKQGVDTGISADLTVFTDGESISDWAYTSVSWAVRSGLMNGMGDGTLSPNSGATRAQVAAIFMRAADIITK